MRFVFRPRVGNVQFELSIGNTFRVNAVEPHSIDCAFTTLTRLRKCILQLFRARVANEHKLPIKIIFTLRKLNVQVLAINFSGFKTGLVFLLKSLYLCNIDTFTNHGCVCISALTTSATTSEFGFFSFGASDGSMRQPVSTYMSYFHD